MQRRDVPRPVTPPTSNGEDEQFSCYIGRYPTLLLACHAHRSRTRPSSVGPRADSGAMTAGTITLSWPKGLAPAVHHLWPAGGERAPGPVVHHLHRRFEHAWVCPPDPLGNSSWARRDLLLETADGEVSVARAEYHLTAGSSIGDRATFVPEIVYCTRTSFEPVELLLHQRDGAFAWTSPLMDFIELMRSGRRRHTSLVGTVAVALDVLADRDPDAANTQAALTALLDSEWAALVHGLRKIE